MSRKQQRRQRHRVEREVEEAWQALEDGERALAVRLARRAGEEGAVNPRVLLDCGRILLLCDEDEDAEAALRESIRLAPNYADAFAALAELQAKAHKMAAAVRLQEKVVELEPGNEVARRRLLEWEAVLSASGAAREEPTEDTGGGDATSQPSPSTLAFARRMGKCDLSVLSEEVMRQGWSGVRGVLSERDRADLLAAYGAEAGLSQEFVVPHEQRRARYRWILEPLPELVVGLRAALWPVAVGLTFLLQAMLARRSSVFPASLDAWLAASRARGTRPESIRLVRLEAGVAMPPTRLESHAAFPLRAVVDLGGGAGSGPDDATLVLTDQRPGKKVRSQRARTEPGDVLLFCARERLDRVGDAFGLQPVKFAFGPFAGGRMLLDLAFEGDS